ncbi:hypothetical protein K7G98_05850 [Saccharothrix sp. MB29]|nr:hypothetical protein [Saccharothrix sp. MB29]
MAAISRFPISDSASRAVHRVDPRGRGPEWTTTRTTSPTCRASTYRPSTRSVPSTSGSPDRSTRVIEAPPTGVAPTGAPPSGLPSALACAPPTSSARSPCSSSCDAGASARSSVPVTFVEAASRTRSLPSTTVTTRLPSVLTRSGSSTPRSWVLVPECSGAEGSGADWPGADFSPADRCGATGGVPPARESSATPVSPAAGTA